MDVLRCQGCGFLFNDISDYYNLQGSCCDAKKIDTLEKRVAELEKRGVLWVEYASFLTAEIEEMAPFADAQGWRCSQSDEGKRLREGLGVTEEELRDARKELKGDP